jgi:hypothetical protein
MLFKRLNKQNKKSKRMSINLNINLKN